MQDKETREKIGFVLFFLPSYLCDPCFQYEKLIFGFVLHFLLQRPRELRVLGLFRKNGIGIFAGARIDGIFQNNHVGLSPFCPVADAPGFFIPSFAGKSLFGRDRSPVM
jgi:hypothetical protein